MLKDLNNENFEQYKNAGLKLIMFGSDLCHYCVKQKPILEELTQNNISIGKVDAYKNPELIQKYGITSFPTFIIFKFGDMLTKFKGFKSKSELLNTILRYI